jgi:hypothetical protein
MDSSETSFAAQTALTYSTEQASRKAICVKQNFIAFAVKSLIRVLVWQWRHPKCRKQKT